MINARTMYPQIRQICDDNGWTVCDTRSRGQRVTFVSSFKYRPELSKRTRILLEVKLLVLMIDPTAEVYWHEAKVNVGTRFTLRIRFND